MESKEQLEQELKILKSINEQLKKLKNKERIIKLKLMCLDRNITINDLCKVLGINTEKLINDMMTNSLKLNVVFKIQEILKLNINTMTKLFF